MSGWKTLLLVVVIGAGLWWLYPPRQLGPKAERQEGVVEITYMGPGGPIAGAMEDVVREFEKVSREAHRKDPSKPIYRVVSGQNAARDQVSDPTRFLVSVAGGMPPDVIYFDRFAVAEWAARGAFEPLDRFIAADRAAGLTDYPHPERYYKACWDEAVLDGHPYGVAISVDDRCLFYNKDLLQKAGLVYAGDDPEVKAGRAKAGDAKPPRTWEELREYTVKLTEWEDAGKTRFKVVGFAPQFGNSWLYLYGWLNGGEFMAPDGRKCTLNDPKIVEALQYIKEVYDSIGGYKTVKAFEAGFQGDDLDPFITGKVAMKIDGVWILNNLAQFGRDCNFGVAPPPVPKARYDQGVRVSWTGGWALAIPAKSTAVDKEEAEKRKQAAWELIRFLCSDRGLRLYAEADRQNIQAQGKLYMPGQCPVKTVNQEFYEKYVANNPQVPAKFAEGLRCFNEMLPYARFRPVTPVGQRLWNAHRDAMEDGLYGKRTPQAALDYHTAIVQRALDDYYSPKPGIPITNWKWFFGLYGVLVLVIAGAVYSWDTKQGVRQRLVRLLPWYDAGKDPGVIPGARGGYFRKQWKHGALCAAPWLLGFLVFGGGPMLFSVVMSLCDYDVINTPRFVGPYNYTWMFLHDEVFYTALWNTTFMVLAVPLGMALSLAIALLLNAKIRGMAVWRTFFYLPAIMPGVAAFKLWGWLLNPDDRAGLINKVLHRLHFEALWNPCADAFNFVVAQLHLTGVLAKLDHGLPLWLTDQLWSKPSLIFMGLWGAGGGMIIWLAGLKGIPVSLYEAAAVDGANAWQRFRHVTIPQLTPYIFFNLVMGMIGVFQIFDAAFIMTEGGPADSTLFYVYHLFNNAFRYGKMGQASAMAWVLLLLVLVLTLVQLKLSKRWVHYESE